MSAIRFKSDIREKTPLHHGRVHICQAIAEVEAETFTAAEKDLLDHLAASTYKLIRNSRL